MRLLKVELKRILKTRLTVILLSAALLLSFLLAWLPVTFSLNSYIDTEGKTVTLKGLPSIAYEKQLQADIAGTVTSEKVRAALDHDTAWILPRICPTVFTNRKSFPMRRFCMGSEKPLPIRIPELHRA